MEVVVGFGLLLVLAAGHWLLWKRLVRGFFGRENRWRTGGAAAVVLSAVLCTAAFLFGPDTASPRHIGILAVPAQAWLAFLPYLVAVLAAAELVRLPLACTARAGRRDRSATAADRHPISRRQLLNKAVTAAAVLSSAALYGLANPPRGTMMKTLHAPLEVSLPFTGKWKVQNSPLRRVPSHGTHLLATTYSIDFVGVDDADRTAPTLSWRTAFGTEPPELFFAFGRPILAPVTGEVVSVHDGETDHEARRSQLALIPYMLGQQGRLRQGAGAIAGNYVLIAMADGGAVLGVMHLRSGSIRVGTGQYVEEGQQIGDCGNSGNSTQPHVHVQAMDGTDPWTARGLPLVFRSFGEKPARGSTFLPRVNMLPQEASTVEAF